MYLRKPIVRSALASDESVVLIGISEPVHTQLNTKVLLRQTVSILTPLVLLVLWEIGVHLKWIDDRFFPAPSSIGATLLTLFQTGEIWPHIGASLSRVALGFLCGSLTGIIIGLVMGISPLVRASIRPLIEATFPIPKIAILPLFLIIFGLGEASKIAIIAVAVFYLVLINTLAGVANIPSIYLDVGRNFQANRWLMFRDIALPGALPSIFTGLKTGMGVALLVIVSAEFVGANSGLGYFIWSAWSVFDVRQMYAGLVLIAVLGMTTTAGLNRLERWVIPWQR